MAKSMINRFAIIICLLVLSFFFSAGCVSPVYYNNQVLQPQVIVTKYENIKPPYHPPVPMTTFNANEKPTLFLLNCGGNNIEINIKTVDGELILKDTYYVNADTNIWQSYTLKQGSYRVELLLAGLVRDTEYFSVHGDSSSNAFYTGELKNGSPHGKGKYEFSRLGETITMAGVSKEGTMDGKFIASDTKGSNHILIFDNGSLISSEGKSIYKDGTVQQGFLDHRTSRGKGTIKWPNQKFYTGNWIKAPEGEPEIPDGTGEMTFPDGRKYTGAFRNGKLEGMGKMVFPDGKVQEGTWSNDVCISQNNTPTESKTNINGVLNISSTTKDCEIIVDGKFMGNTPATIKLKQGTHNIVLKKQGFISYKRDIEITGGSDLSINVSLEKE
ncbi:MAG: PEGA domain-containing protein [Desulfobacterales bacterium]|nr:PEGA domain-containing protein [Desulfobacterales bacterium]